MRDNDSVSVATPVAAQGRRVIVIYYVSAMIKCRANLYKSLKDVVRDYIINEIDEGRLCPGHRIHEKEISEELQVSRTPVREALLQLEPTGLVSFYPRQGIVLNDLTPDDTRDLFQTIGPLEAAAARLAIPLLDAKAFDAMERSIKKMDSLMTAESVIRDRKPRELNRENQAFHEIYITRCGNKLLIETVRDLKRRFYVVPHPMVYLDEYERRVMDEHRELLELFRKLDADGAADLLQNRHWNWEHNRQYALDTYFPGGRGAAVG